MALATQAQGSRSIPRPHSHHEPDDPYDQWLLTFPAASPSKMSREKTRDQIGNSIENVPEIVSATVHQIIRAIVGVTVRRCSPQGSGAESLGIVENIDGDEEVKLAGDESIGRSTSPPIPNQAARLVSTSRAMRSNVTFTSRVSRSVSFFDAPGRSRTLLTPAFAIFFRQ